MNDSGPALAARSSRKRLLGAVGSRPHRASVCPRRAGQRYSHRMLVGYARVSGTMALGILWVGAGVWLWCFGLRKPKGDR